MAVVVSSRKKNRVILDAIHGLSDLDSNLRKVIDTPELQRLRGIRQTGLLSLVYPGAEHSRFAHSLGTYAVARSVFAYLREQMESFGVTEVGLTEVTRLDEDRQKAFEVAALCHDVGHSPFSHALETVLLPDSFKNHEECTLALLSQSPALSKALRGYCDLEEVIGLLKRENWNTYLCDLISGPYDVDRWDYMLRDAHNAGLTYGKHDHTWIVHAMDVRLQDNRPVLVLDLSKSVTALEHFLNCRRYMYQTAYYHKTVQAAEFLLRSTIERALTLAKEGRSKDISLAPWPLSGIFGEDRLSLEQFVQLQDCHVSVALVNWASNAEDGVLKELAGCLHRRHLPRPLPIALSSADEAYSLKSSVRPIVLNKLKDIPGISDATVDHFVCVSENVLGIKGLEEILVDVNGNVEPVLEAIKDTAESAYIEYAIQSQPQWRVFVHRDAWDDAVNSLRGKETQE